MDIATLTAFLAPFLPWLTKLGQKAAETAAGKFGEDAWNKAKALWGKLQPQVEAKPDMKMAVEQVAAKPDSPARQAVLQEELTTLLQEHPDLAVALTQILTEQTPNGTPGLQIVQTVIGNKNQTLGQVYGGIVIGNINEAKRL